MWCAACSKPTDGRPRYCDQCGAAQGSAASVTLPGHLLTRAGRTVVSHGRRPRPQPYRGIWWTAACLLATGAVALGARAWFARTPQPGDGELHLAILAAVAGGAGPGIDPVCVANGLPYDEAPVHVQGDDAPTVAWMNTLVRAGLYQTPEPAQAQAAGQSAPAALRYVPLAALAQWTGPRRLCIARAIRPQRVVNAGAVEEMWLRGRQLPGLSANVVWTLDRPAPWLAGAEIGEAFARELPTWRGARWQGAGRIWQLVQRKHFYLVDGRWMTSEMVERQTAGLSAAASPLQNQ